MKENFIQLKKDDILRIRDKDSEWRKYWRTFRVRFARHRITIKIKSMRSTTQKELGIFENAIYYY